MPDDRTAQQFRRSWRRRTTRDFFLLAIPFFLLAAGCIALWIFVSPTLGTVLGVVLVLAAGILSSVREQRPLHRFRCECCGEPLPSPVDDLHSGRRIRFHCPSCDIVWDTGIVYRQGSGFESGYFVDEGARRR